MNGRTDVQSFVSNSSFVTLLQASDLHMTLFFVALIFRRPVTPFTGAQRWLPWRTSGRSRWATGGFVALFFVAL